jgi:hypothetical protein
LAQAEAASRGNWCGWPFLALELSCDFGELGESGLQIFDNLGGDDVGLGQIGAVFERLVGAREFIGTEWRVSKN